MIYLTYCSASNWLMSSAELVELLRLSRRNNERDGITGMLLYHDGSFMQVLEGEATAVQAAYARITADDRHRGLIKLTEAPLAERNFSQWSMGFRDTRELGADDLAGFSLFLKPSFDPDQYRDHRALKLLIGFRDIAHQTGRDLPP